MFLNKKGQSTAEYAIVIGLVIAVAAGVLQIALKGGISAKHAQSIDKLLAAGNTAEDGGEGLGDVGAGTQTPALYSQDLRETTVLKGDDYVDTTVMAKGGSEEKKQVQTTTTSAVNIETIKPAAQE